MKEIFKIAWRNLWRNRRRTFITAGSVFFAVFFAIVMRSFQLGTYGHMIRQSIESYTGYLQVQNPDYFDDPNIDNSFEYTSQLESLVGSISNIKVLVPRIESFALASSGLQSKGVLVSGISPEKEKEMSNPEHKLVRFRITEKAIENLKQQRSLPDEIFDKVKNAKGSSFISKEQMGLELGFSKKQMKYTDTVAEQCKFASNYLTSNDDGVLISDKLSKYLMASVGDSIVLMGQGYQGTSAAGVFPVRGIVKIPAPDLDNKLVYMTLAQASQFLGLDNRITSFSINLKNIDEMDETREALTATIHSSDFVVKDWQEIMPTMKQQIEGDSVSGIIFLGILYVIVFFGIFGTVMMMVSERIREFGVMVAVGMKQYKLASIVTVEMLFIGLMGTIAGMISSVPIVLYGYYNPFRMTGKMAQMYIDMGFDPVMPMAWFDSYFYLQGIVIFIMVLLASVVPIHAILKLNVIKSLRH